jgi:hypothetical protein
MKNKNLILFILCSIAFSKTYAQQNAKVGLTATIQESSMGIMVPVWFTNHFMLAPAFSMKTAQNIGTDYSIGFIPRFYFKKETLSPYIGLKIGSLINMPSSTNTVSTSTVVDFMGGIAFGAEYFLSDHFSLGVEAQGNYTKSGKDSNRFGNPGGSNFNTATMFLATVYF